LYKNCHPKASDFIQKICHPKASKFVDKLPPKSIIEGCLLPTKLKST